MAPSGGVSTFPTRRTAQPLSRPAHRLPGLDLVGLRRYSSPQCNPLTGTGCPGDGIPVFTSVFAQDTIASSAYNSLQVSLEKRFAHGLQFTAAYTWSKSIDEASSFEGILDPLPGAKNYAPSLFDARHRFVVSYYWDVPARKYSGVAGKLLDGWAVSGITTYQTGFPIRITSNSDNELMNSASFEYPGGTRIRSRHFSGSGRKVITITTLITSSIFSNSVTLGRLVTRHVRSVAGRESARLIFLPSRTFRSANVPTSNFERSCSMCSTTRSSLTRTATSPMVLSLAGSHRSKTHVWRSLL